MHKEFNEKAAKETIVHFRYLEKDCTIREICKRTGPISGSLMYCALVLGFSSISSNAKTKNKIVF